MRRLGFVRNRGQPWAGGMLLATCLVGLLPAAGGAQVPTASEWTIRTATRYRTIADVPYLTANSTDGTNRAP